MEVNGQQVVAVLQDIVAPSDILLQVLQAADIPITPPSEPSTDQSVPEPSELLFE